MICSLVFVVVLSGHPDAAVAMPNLRSVSVDRAQQMVELRGLRLAAGVYFLSPNNWRSDIEPETTYLQYPQPEAATPKGAEAAIWTFRKAVEGQELMETPDFVGQTWGEVKKELEDSPLELMNDTAFCEDAAVVTDQYPRAGSKTYAGTSIFFVAKKEVAP